MVLIGERSFLSEGYFVEALDLDVISNSALFISPITEDKLVPSLMERAKNTKGKFYPPKIVSFLFYTGEETLTNYSAFGEEIFLAEFKTSLLFLGDFYTLDDTDINIIRDSALTIEKSNFEAALPLYRVAKN